mgnify:CR=1 FL=1
MIAAKIQHHGKVTMYSTATPGRHSLDNLLLSKSKERKYKINKDAIKSAGAVLANKCKRVWVITLTTTCKEEKLNETNNALNLYIKNLEQNYSLKAYVGVVEFQGNGNIHYHLLCRIDTYKIDIVKFNAAWCKALSNALHVNYYYANAVRVGGIAKSGRRYYYITSINHAVAYLVKYMSKGSGKHVTKCYFISKTLRVKPLKVFGTEVYNMLANISINKTYIAEYVTIYYIEPREAIEIIEQFYCLT